MSDTLIHYPLYLGDYLKETIGFTQEQRGAYIDLCVAYIQNNGRLKDDESLYILTRCFSEQNRASVAAVVERAFKQKNGYIISESLETLISRQKSMRDQRIAAGKASAKKRAQKQRAFQQSESESEPEPESELELQSKSKKQVGKSPPSLDELSISHIQSWLDKKRKDGYYQNIDEVALLEYFKNWASGAKPKKDYVATFRNSFAWEDIEKKCPAKKQQYTKSFYELKQEAELWK